MLKRISIKSLYTLALAELEGVGTAYEYFVKRLRLARFLGGIARPQRILLAGIPEKYGVSLDSFLLAEELDATLTVADERPWALEKARAALDQARAAGALTKLQAHFLHVEDLVALKSGHTFDLCLSPEVLQRLPSDLRPIYVCRLRELAPAVALFAPNADNIAHTTISGLDGVSLAELQALGMVNGRLPQAGYIDLPPFPPGIQRSEEERRQASHGRLEAAAMWGLAYYALMEEFLPRNARRRYAHIVYAFVQS